MTYCAGWKYGGSVYLMGDTAVTQFAEATTTHSSFGEFHAEVKGKYVQEGLLKIIPINDYTAIAFSGNVQLANELIVFIKDNFEGLEKIDELAYSLMASYGPFDKSRAVELLIASYSSGLPKLVYWSTVDGLDTRDLDYYQIGSLTSYHSAITPNVLSVLVSGKLAPDRMLSLMTAVVQSYGVHDNLIEMNVGGIIFGLRVHCNGVVWQEDTSYILYDSGFKNPAFISAFVRDNALVVSSSINNDIRILGHSVSMVSSSDWLTRWRSTIEEQLSSDSYRYWIFIKINEKVITIIRREDFNKESSYLRLNAEGDGKFLISMSPKLMGLLNKPLVNRNDGSFPFTLNFLND